VPFGAPLPADIKEKIAHSATIDVEGVITASDVHSSTKFRSILPDKASMNYPSLVKLDAKPRDLSRWTGMLERDQNPEDEVNIGLVGKYVETKIPTRAFKEPCCTGRWLIV